MRFPYEMQMPLTTETHICQVLLRTSILQQLRNKNLCPLAFFYFFDAAPLVRTSHTSGFIPLEHYHLQPWPGQHRRHRHMLHVEGCSALGNGTAAYAFAADQQFGKTTAREHMPAEVCETRLNRGIPPRQSRGHP
jgi:hypothetical protein